MRRWTRMTVWPGLLTATALLTASCDRSPEPAGAKLVGQPSLWEGFVPATDRMTGGGKLGDGHDFATFGFEVRPGKVNLEWVQHCDAVNPSSPTCSFGQFTFHAATLDEYLQDQSDPAHCRIWTGTGDVKLKDPSMQQYNGTYNFTVDRACDFGEPGNGTDFMSLTISSYHRGEILNGGNIQLHKEKP